MTLRAHLAALALAGAAALASVAPAAAQRIEAGVLRCLVSGGGTFIIGSSRSLDCVFQPSRGGPVERYAGQITRFGVDLGVTGGGELVWGVLAPTAGYKPYALEGAYVGVSGEATLGVGLGANALVGGFDRSIALNPVSVQGQTGISIAAGVAGLELRRLR